VRAVIAGGGTGGHLFPAIALAEELRSRSSDLSLLFVGAKERMDRSLIGARGWEFEGISAGGVLAGRWPARLRSLALVPFGVMRALSILRRFSPDIVIGLGGYASAAAVLAAVLSRIPTVIHEQNIYPGLTNRWLGRFVDRVAVAFEPAAARFPGAKVRVTGNPIRRELFGAGVGEARARLHLDPDRLALLIFGGSQGAHRLNQAVLDALPMLGGDREVLQFIHATGARDLAAVRQGYLAAGCRAVVESFFWEMAHIYAAADLCLCRAGAGTISELCALGKPSILVPYPFAANDHQRWNAEWLVASGAALMVLDRDLTGAAVAGSVRALLRDRRRLGAMSERAAALAKPDAAARVADLVAEAVHAPQYPADANPSTVNRPR
jgi:UDP-N-acetylglucosamine--N-acetylmuramyl-(pentapeptide) pyrophosphoryl-undecaprenol N-acetylglucosamine transferase